MVRIRWLSVFLAMMTALSHVNMASAFLHTGLGRFLQQDLYGTTVASSNLPTPVMQGFIPRDTSVQYDDSRNLYEYVGSSPSHYVDPSGLRIEIYAYDNNKFPGYVDKVVAGFQSIIGDCAKLRAVRVIIPGSGDKGHKPKESDWSVIRYDDTSKNNPNCKCDDCWQTLKKMLDSRGKIIQITYIGVTNNAWGETEGWGPTVSINPNVSVSLPEIDPSGGPNISTPATFNVVLWHEAIGHSGLGLKHPNEPWNHTGGGGYDPTIQEENNARNCLRKQGIGVRDRIHTYYY